MQGILVNLNRRQKAAILLGVDAVVAVVALLAADSLYDGASGVVTPLIAVIFGAAAAGLSYALGAARTVLSAFDARDVLRLAGVALALGAAMLVCGPVVGIDLAVPVALTFSALMLCFAVLARMVLVVTVDTVLRRMATPHRVVIYGAGAAGQQLQAALKNAHEASVVAFVDDNPTIQGAMIGGLKVRAPSRLPEIIERTGATRILLAIPSLENERRQEILARLGGLTGDVLALPSYVDLMRKGNLVAALRPVDPDELLGRAVVEIDLPEVRGCYAGRSVLVSGAGGSIGSELCRQILDARPRKLVLFEMSEFALYAIEMELRKHRMAAEVEIVPVLGSVCDRVRALGTLRAHDIDIVLHAAAYKHVPLVEVNPLEAARNNVLGTHAMAMAAIEAGVDRFILVSTDKAVRPTNVMGATKRLAELVIQDLQSRSSHTIFSMVRFGNVLGSSGSVIPLFKKQIREGGPITVTHPEVTRYFMTIPEAARLVLLAGSFAEGGEVFVLDMGSPVRIADLARRLIEISGLTVRDGLNPEGDIEIAYTGLRPGEKLYEELLIGGNTIATPHQKIMRAMEDARSEIEVASALRKIRLALETGDTTIVRPLLLAMVDGYKPDAHAITQTIPKPETA